jgi:hypothetical protein
VLLAAVVLIVGCTGGVHAQTAETTAPVDARIQTLVDLHILTGNAGGLQLDRQVSGGEFVVLVERVLQQPQLASQSLATSSSGNEAVGWIRAYAWLRNTWTRVLDVRREIRHIWFGLRSERTNGSPWGIQRNSWLFTSLRDAYLDDKLIDLSFEPMKQMSGSDGINMVLTAAGFGGEVDAMKTQMNDPVGDAALQVVCRQHGFDQVMQYAGKPMTRGDAAILAWRLLVERTGSAD